MWTKLFQLAWRNIWRQKRRTVLTLSAISLGLGALLFMLNLSEGMTSHMVKMGTQSMVADAQIHAPNYLLTGDPDQYMQGAAKLLTRARAHEKVLVAAPRTYYPVLAAMGDRSAALTLLGIEPDSETKITNWSKRLAAGSWLDGDKKVLLGAALAENLELDVNSKLVLTTSNRVTGELSSMLVHVAGILSSENQEINRYMVIAPMKLAEELVGLKDVAHEIVLKLAVDLNDQPALEAVLAEIAPPAVSAIPWQVRMAGLLNGMKLQRKMNMVTFVVIFILAALGIANTMGMSILERIREFGVLQAIGTTPTELAGMVALEYVCLGLLGATTGFLFGIGTSHLAMYTGIPLNNVEVGGMLINEPLKPIMVWGECIRYTLVFAALVPLLCIMPIRKVMSYDPAVSLRFNG